MEIRQKHPRYAALQYPTPLGLKAIQESLDAKTVLLEYSLGKEASYLFAISRNDFVTARLPASPLLTNQVTALREAVATKPDRMALSNYLQNARSLYQDLVQPANRLLSGKQSLIIVPDGILHYLPFEVLLKSDSGRTTQLDLHQLPYLIRDVSISYAPSATVLVNLHGVDPTTRSPRKAFLAYGDPHYGKTESDQPAPIRSALRSAFGDGKPWELQPLPESRHEVERIAKLYSREQVGVFLGGQASEENVKAADNASQYRFVHFAVHGLLNENKPQYSGLVLSLPRDERVRVATEKEAATVAASTTGVTSEPNDASRTEDGLLQVYEIFNLKLNADLVVLSACETGLGKETKGEGLVGLTQAFFYAGTPSLAVSLWKVQDRSTAELMVRFYRHLNNPEYSKAQALRQAQLEMIRKGDFSHPYYWAGFVLIGQPK
jgi:CHAT domain-containing protein